MKDFFDGGGFNIAKRYDRFRRRLLKHSYISMTDNTEVVVENVMKIISCESDLVKLRLVANTVVIAGNRLQLDALGGDVFAGDAGVTNVTVRGKIYDIGFEDVR
ncbi:hypothetical protein FACS1894133_6830 [Clostridia bacterium]|nr:hypothetical protein FACS1894133_6830 [Clostridia bacterium]